MSTPAPARTANPADTDTDPEVDAFTGLPVRKPESDAAPTPDASNEPLVDLDDGPKPAFVRKGGRLYELRSVNDFGLRTQQRLRVNGQEYFRYYNADEVLSDDDAQRMEMLLDEMFDEVLKAPKAIKAKMTETEKAQVVLGFTLAPLAQRAAAMAQAQQAAEALDSDRTTGS